MKNQLNLLNQLQELILTRDEHFQTGDGSHIDGLNASIEALEEKIELPAKRLYQMLYKRNHIVMSAMVDGCCAVCGMRLPISQCQQVRLARSLQVCSSCGRILFNEEDDAPHAVGAKTGRSDPHKTGILRFSAEELCVCPLASSTPAGAIGELAEAMVRNKFVSNAPALVAAAMEREAVLPTSFGRGMALPHVRGVEGGGLTMAIGVSKEGIDWDGCGDAVKVICFSVIPIAVSPFYLRLMGAISEAFRKDSAIRQIVDSADGPELWKNFVRATRHAVK